MRKREVKSISTNKIPAILNQMVWIEPDADTGRDTVMQGKKPMQYWQSAGVKMTKARRGVESTYACLRAVENDLDSSARRWASILTGSAT